MRTTPEIIALMLTATVGVTIMFSCAQALLRGELPVDARAHLREVTILIIGVVSGYLGHPNKPSVP